jgi:uncharacterized protein (DUF2249 family)
MEIPEANRPTLSGYVEAGKLLPWRWADHRLSLARNYWISTHARSYPSSRPVWGIWENTELWFSTGSRIATNLGRDPRVQVNLESGDELVILEGHADGLPKAQVRTWVARYREKYDWEMPESAEGVYRVVPRRVLAWICDSSGLDAGAQFSNSATEWRFD